MSKVLSAAKWSLDLLAQRIASLRSKKNFDTSSSSMVLTYDESQMKEADPAIRQQRSEIEYDC